jgi:UDP-N-acetylmuramyl pentapeptide synthase
MEKKFINFEIPDGRGDIKVIKKFNKRFEFIDESYNANPLSMTSAIKNVNFHKRKNNGKKLVFLGDMLELGKDQLNFTEHYRIQLIKVMLIKFSFMANISGKPLIICMPIKKVKYSIILREARNHFAKIIRNNDLLMVKGSNATGLNRFSKNIKRGQISAI